MSAAMASRCLRATGDLRAVRPVGSVGLGVAGPAAGTTYKQLQPSIVDCAIVTCSDLHFTLWCSEVPVLRSLKMLRSRMQKAGLIPRIFHQTWKSKSDMDQRFQFWRNSFFLKNPDLHDQFYDDADNLNLVKRLVPSLLSLYREFPREIFRVDFVRPFYMFFKGGLYADLDFHCLRSFDEVFSTPNTIFLGSMGTDQYFAHSIPNAMMASPPSEGFWLGYLKNIEAAWDAKKSIANIERKPEQVTGPIVLKQTLSDYQNLEQFKQDVLAFARRHGIRAPDGDISFSPLTILAGHIWYPLNWGDVIHQMFRRNVLAGKSVPSDEEASALFPHSMAVTYWTHAW